MTDFTMLQFHHDKIIKAKCKGNCVSQVQGINNYDMITLINERMWARNLQKKHTWKNQGKWSVAVIIRDIIN